jgi:hypothetical protein
MPNPEERTRAGAGDPICGDAAPEQPDGPGHSGEREEADKDGRQALNLAAPMGV